MLVLIGRSPANAAEPSVVMIQSQDLPIYRQAIEGFRRVYPGPFQEIDLEGDSSRADAVMRSLRARPPDVVVAVGLLAARMAKQGMTGVPIVFCMVFDPQRFSLTGEDVTGVSLEVPVSKIFSEIRRLFPEVRHVGVLYDPKKSGRLVGQAEMAAQSRGMSLTAIETRSEKELPNAVRTLPKTVDLLWMIPDSTVLTPESLDILLTNSFSRNLPIVTFSDDLVRRGAVAALSPDYEAMGEEAGRMTLEVMDGVRPGRLPIRSAQKVRLSINLTTAQKMGVSLNPAAVQSADQVYD